MSEERSSLISSENLPTVAAVGFILGLLGVVIGFWSLKHVFGINSAFRAEHAVVEAGQKTNAAQDAKISALEAKIAALEAAAAAPAATEPAAEPAAK